MAGGFPAAPAPERLESRRQIPGQEINLDENGPLANVHERVLGGDFLMNAGIRINWKNAFQSVCMEVTEMVR